MDASDELNEVVTAGRTVRLIEEDIYSVLPDVSVQHLYDKRASLYDFFVSTRLYNYVMWGASPGHYSQFAREALNSSHNGIFLDAGCGSLLFTARDYAASKRRIVAFDQSLAMLRRARERLRDLSGGVPANIRLFQADLTDLPFRPQKFRTVMCLNVLHQISDAAALVADLKELLTQDGSLHMTSLISNNRAIGDWYLQALYRTGEFVRPRNERELRELFVRSFSKRISYVDEGNMAFITGLAGG